MASSFLIHQPTIADGNHLLWEVFATDGNKIGNIMQDLTKSDGQYYFSSNINGVGIKSFSFDSREEASSALWVVARVAFGL